MFLAVSRVFRGIMGCSRGVPGLFRVVPGCSGGVPGMFRGCSGGVPRVFRGVPGCSGFYRYPVNNSPIWLETENEGIALAVCFVISPDVSSSASSLVLEMSGFSSKKKNQLCLVFTCFLQTR